MSINISPQPSFNRYTEAKKLIVELSKQNGIENQLKGKANSIDGLMADALLLGHLKEQIKESKQVILDWAQMNVKPLDSESDILTQATQVAARIDRLLLPLKDAVALSKARNDLEKRKGEEIENKRNLRELESQIPQLERQIFQIDHPQSFSILNIFEKKGDPAALQSNLKSLKAKISILRDSEVIYNQEIKELSQKSGEIEKRLLNSLVHDEFKMGKKEDGSIRVPLDKRYWKQELGHDFKVQKLLDEKGKDSGFKLIENKILIDQQGINYIQKNMPNLIGETVWVPMKPYETQFADYQGKLQPVQELSVHGEKWAVLPDMITGSPNLCNVCKRDGQAIILVDLETGKNVLCTLSDNIKNPYAFTPIDFQEALFEVDKGIVKVRRELQEPVKQTLEFPRVIKVGIDQGIAAKDNGCGQAAILEVMFSATSAFDVPLEAECRKGNPAALFLKNSIVTPLRQQGYVSNEVLNTFRQKYLNELSAKQLEEEGIGAAEMREDIGFFFSQIAKILNVSDHLSSGVCPLILDTDHYPAKPAQVIITDEKGHRIGNTLVRTVSTQELIDINLKISDSQLVEAKKRNFGAFPAVLFLSSPRTCNQVKPNPYITLDGKRYALKAVISMGSSHWVSWIRNQNAFFQVDSQHPKDFHGKMMTSQTRKICDVAKIDSEVPILCDNEEVDAQHKAFISGKSPVYAFKTGATDRRKRAFPDNIETAMKMSWPNTPTQEVLDLERLQLNANSYLYELVPTKF